MAKHSVTMDLPSREVKNAPVEFPVLMNDKKLGTLQVSNGRIAWLPKSAQKNRLSLNWTEFAALMEERGKSW